MKDETISGITFSEDKSMIEFLTNSGKKYWMVGKHPVFEIYGDLIDIYQTKIDEMNVIEDDEIKTFELITCKGIVCFEWNGFVALEEN